MSAAYSFTREELMELLVAATEEGIARARVNQRRRRTSSSVATKTVTIYMRDVVKDASELTLYIGMSNQLATRLAMHEKREMVRDVYEAIAPRGGIIGLDVWEFAIDQNPDRCACENAERWLFEAHGLGRYNGKPIDGRANPPRGPFTRLLGPDAMCPNRTGFEAGVYRWFARVDGHTAEQCEKLIETYECERLRRVLDSVYQPTGEGHGRCAET